MDAKPNRRWLQFSLRTLFIGLTVGAMAAGWWQHRGYCLAKAQEQETCALLNQLNWVICGRLDEEFSRRDVEEAQIARERLLNLANHHLETSVEYRRAIWLPWLRWSIDEPPRDAELEKFAGP